MSFINISYCNKNNNKKNIWNILAVILQFCIFFATAFMAVSTYLLAIETRNLVKADLNPQIAPYDTRLMVVDSGGTPVRITSWQQGELLPNRTVEMAKLGLSVKLINTGKKSVDVELVSITDKKTGEDLWGKKGLKYTIPGLGNTTGYLGAIEIRNIFSQHIKKGNKSEFVIDYEFKILDSEQKNFKFSVQCFGDIGIYEGKDLALSNAACFPAR